jgi:SagB-type dehydrogenase family enzyme
MTGRPSLRDYHQATRHSLQSVQASAYELDWPNQPLAFKIYTSLEPIPLPASFSASELPAIMSIAGACRGIDGALTRDSLARLCYFSNGITRVLRRMPFRAAACTGALYHVELYPIVADLPDVEAGVYHYAAHDHALRELRRGDFRGAVVSATGGEPAVADAPLIVAVTSTWWRNAWKYRARAYRHAFWDSGTILANLLSVACALSIPARVVTAFADPALNVLLGVDPQHEGTLCLVALGRGRAAPARAPQISSLNLATRALSAHEVEYAEIVAAHAASSLQDGEAAAAWRGARPNAADTRARPFAEAAGVSESIEAVILRRGSSRAFSHASISNRDLEIMLRVATAPVAWDAPVPTSQLYVIVNAVEGLPSGAYVFDRENGELQLLREGAFRRDAAYLDLGQELAGDAAINVYWLATLDDDDRGYRAAQLAAAIEAGRLYLAAYSLGLGATGLTFFDDEVTRFFSPSAAGKSVMFLTAVGHPRRSLSA